MLILIGVILMVVGIVLAIGGTIWQIQDPADNAIEKLTFTSSGTQQVDLKKGDYQMWVKADLFGYYGTVEITDSQGDTVWSGPDTGMTETINDKKNMGDFTIGSRGTYNVTVDSSGTFYITEPTDINLGGIFGTFCAGGVVALVGVIVLLIGIIMALRSDKPAQPAPAPYPPPGQYPPPPQGQYPPQQQGQYPPQQQSQYPPQQQGQYPPPTQQAPPPQQPPPEAPPAEQPPQQPPQEPDGQ